MSLKDSIRTIKDFPIKGINFRDITTNLLSPNDFTTAIDQMNNYCQNRDYNAFAAIESRGFIFASTLAYLNKKPLALIRKPKKLPYKTISAKYKCEYGYDSLEIHIDALKPKSKVIIVDDLLATGGTALATASLVEQLNCSIDCFLFLVGLPDIGGVQILNEHNYNFKYFIEFEGD